MIRDISFDGNAHACDVGVLVSGQIQPVLAQVSFSGFGVLGLDWKGQNLTGGAKGSVVHPYFINLAFGMQNAGDGVGMQFDGQTGSGDVFGAEGVNIRCVQHDNPCIVINRSDHNRIDDIQVTTSGGATASYSMIVACGTISFYAGNLLMQQPTYIQGTTDCTRRRLNPPRGTVFRYYQDYANDAPAPIVGAGGQLVMTDDKGNWFGGNQNSPATQTFFCFGAPFLDSNNQNGCTQGAGIYYTDALGYNMALGTRGTPGTQGMHLEFCMDGCGSGSSAAHYGSFIDENDCFAFGTVGPTAAPSASPSPSAETSWLCNKSAQVHGPIAAAATGNSSPAPLPMVYNPDGTPVASTEHSAILTCTFVGATSCNLGANYWASGSNFSSATAIHGCAFASNTTDTVAFGFHQTGNSTGTVTATASNSDTVTGICWGT